MKTLVNYNTKTDLMEVIDYETSEIIGTYYYDSYYHQWYVRDARGKHQFKVIRYKTEKGAIGYIERQANKYVPLQQAVKETYGI